MSRFRVYTCLPGKELVDLVPSDTGACLEAVLGSTVVYDAQGLKLYEDNMEKGPTNPQWMQTSVGNKLLSLSHCDFDLFCCCLVGRLWLGWVFVCLESFGCIC